MQKEDLNSGIRKIVSRYPNSKSALLPVLWFVQENLGYISDDSIELIAKELDFAPSEIFGTVTFYTMFNRKRIGRHYIQVCKNICCWLRGSKDILEYFKAKLGIDCFETTEDGQFTLGTVECLGACGGAPVAQIDDEYYENLDHQTIDRLLEELKNLK